MTFFTTSFWLRPSRVVRDVLKHSEFFKHKLVEADWSIGGISPSADLSFSTSTVNFVCYYVISLSGIFNHHIYQFSVAAKTCVGNCDLMALYPCAG